MSRHVNFAVLHSKSKNREIKMPRTTYFDVNHEIEMLRKLVFITNCEIYADFLAKKKGKGKVSNKREV